jgi:tetratricopeptide (TPR) repeat protein
MSKKFPVFVTIFCLLGLSAFAQKIEKPSLTPVQATESQKRLIDEGVKLHDAGKMDEAIQKYEQVLRENPDCDLALYELAMSAFNKKDYPKALEAGYKLVKYKSTTGIAGYGVIGNILDNQGKPQEAIEIYKNAIKQLEGEKGEEQYVSELYYNLAVTYARQDQLKEAREALKKAVTSNFKYASPHSLLSRIFNAEKYKIPALLAASRLIVLEINSTRTAQAVALIKNMVKAPEKNEKGAYTINLDFSAPNDEGDFGAMELVLGTVMVAEDEKDKGLTEGEKFANGIDTVIAILGEQKKLRSTFVGKTYIPFMIEMKARGHSRTFAYLVLQQGGSAEAKNWLVNNSQKLLDLLSWAKAYYPPR